MNGWQIGMLIVASVSVGWGIGVVMGVFSERKAWTMRAITTANRFGTPHHVGKTFYFIIEEGVFVREYGPRISKAVSKALLGYPDWSNPDSASPDSASPDSALFPPDPAAPSAPPASPPNPPSPQEQA